MRGQRAEQASPAGLPSLLRAESEEKGNGESLISRVSPLPTVYSPEWRPRPPGPLGQSPGKGCGRSGWHCCSWRWDCSRRLPGLWTEPATSPLPTHAHMSQDVTSLHSWHCPYLLPGSGLRVAGGFEGVERPGRKGAHTHFQIPHPLSLPHQKTLCWHRRWLPGTAPDVGSW